MKKIIFVMIIAILCMNMSIVAFADDSLENEMNTLIEKYDGEREDISLDASTSRLSYTDKKSIDTFMVSNLSDVNYRIVNGRIMFNNVEDCEKFIVMLKSKPEASMLRSSRKFVTVKLVKGSPSNQAATWSKYSPLSWSGISLLAWDKVYINYDWEDQNGKPVFKSINSVSSSRFAVDVNSSYNHMSHDANPVGSMATCDVKGEIKVGIGVGEVGIGIPFTHTMKAGFELTY